MATRTFQQVLADVTKSSDPQRQAILSQIADLPNQQAADEQGLDAQKNAAYDQITSEAQQRGLGFSGIPLGEQAKYNATDYAPALAKLKSSYVTQKGTLDSALAGIGANDYTTANNIYNQQQSLAEQQREFNANLAEQQKEAAAARSAAAAAASPLSSLFGQPTQQAPAKDPYAAVDKQGAANAVVSLLKTNNPATIAKTISAIGKSAGYGNAYDQYKIALLRQYMASSPYAGIIKQATAGPSVARGIL